MQQKHSPSPWEIVTMDNGKYGWIEDSTGEQVMGLGTLRYSINPEITADFIVRACNAHEELLEAMKKVEGMIYDSDCKTARDAAEILQAVIAKAEKGEKP